MNKGPVVSIFLCITISCTINVTANIENCKYGTNLIEKSKIKCISCQKDYTLKDNKCFKESIVYLNHL